MAMLNVPAFGGGVVLEGSSDAQRTDELRACDSLDIGARGQLVMASDLSDLSSLEDSGGNALLRLHGLFPFSYPISPKVLAIGDDATGEIAVRAIDPADGTSEIPAGGAIAVLLADVAYGMIVTSAGVFYDPNRLTTFALINLGARSFRQPNTMPGLYAFGLNPAGMTVKPISTYDALGTGPESEYTGLGTKAKQLYFRGIAGYNRHAFGWGFMSLDGTNGNGPARLMFSNLGDSLKWGNDPADHDDSIVPSTDRDYVDSDAIDVGGHGSVIRAGLTWASRLWLGASDGLHFVEGYGRESFQTNGAVAVRQSRNVIGPLAMVEGPDGLLHAVGDEGHWIFDGGNTDPVGKRLRSFDQKSNGWWDLIWTDTSRSTGYPGQTNADLVWMLADRHAMQVWMVIPFCDAAAGYGYGTDSVIIKYHCLTGGYTRQVFAGVALTAGCMFPRESSASEARFVAVPGATNNLQRYGWKATPNTSPAFASALPDVTFGEYAPFGPDGVGVLRKRYLTLAWEAASTTLNLVFLLTPTVDGETLGSVTLSITATEPATPSDGDLWLDTSGTDTNLGNGTAGDLVTAHAADYLLKRWKASWNKWVQVPGDGQQGRRVTIPIAFDAARGTRFTVRCHCTAADRRFQIESFGEKPNLVREAA